MTELSVLKLTRPETSPDPLALTARVDRLEQRLRRLQQATPPSPARSVPAPSKQVPAAPPESQPDAVAASSTPQETPEPAPGPVDPEPAPASTQPPVEGLTVDQVEAVWPAIVAGVRDTLGPRRLAFFREAGPSDVDGNTIILSIPAHLSFHLSQLQADPTVAETVAAKAAEMLGGAVQVRFVAEDHQPTSAEPQAVPDTDQLQDAGDAIDPAALVEGLLGGQVIEEISPD
jgi:hypothetical protein